MGPSPLDSPGRLTNKVRTFSRLAAAAALVAAALLPAVSSPAATHAVAPDCGTAVAKPGGGPWVCTFADDFATAGLDTTKWTVQETRLSGFHSGPECFVNQPGNVAADNGTLRLTVRRETAPFTCKSPLGSYTTQYTGGGVSTFGKFSQAFGRFEARAKMPPVTVQGLQEAFWLWPDDATHYGPAWPQSGEIDVAEIYHRYPDRAIPYIHYVPAAYDPNVTNNYCLIDNIAAYHTYTAEWTPQTITIKFDGRTCLVDNWTPAGLTKPAPFDRPFMVALTQALGIGGNAFTSSTPLPATTTVDYVHVWK